MNPHGDLNSLLAVHIGHFVAHQRALGKRFETDVAGLRLLDRYLVTQQLTTLEAITPVVLEAFLMSRPRQPHSFNRLLGVVRRFFDWLVLHEVVVRSPVQTSSRLCPPRPRPFIFDRPQAQRLLDAAAQLPDYSGTGPRGLTYQMGFALMYGLGLRVGEAARLCQHHVDLDRQLLVIVETKFAKSRFVPFGPRMAARLETYIDQAAQTGGERRPEDPLLSVSKDKTRPLYRKRLSQVFHELLPQLDLTIPPGVASPRAHHLRHSFAVNTLLRWYREGIDPAGRLLHLSTFMGHVDPSSTAVYLTITADLLQEASDRFERFASPLLKEISP